MLGWLRFWKKDRKPQVPAAPTARDGVLVRGGTWKNTAAQAPRVPALDDNDAAYDQERLICRLASTDAAVRQSAAAELERRGDRAAEAVPALVHATVSGDATVRQAAGAVLSQILSRLNPEVRPGLEGAALVTELASRCADVRQRAADRLVELGAAVVPLLLHPLADYTDATLQVTVARMLARMGAAAAEAVRPLMHELDSESPLVRQAAADALGAIGPGASAALTALAVKLADWHPAVRRAAARALARVGDTAYRGVPALIQLLADREVSVGEAAIEALANIGSAAVPCIIDTLEARDVRRVDESLHQRLQVSEWFDRPPADAFEREQLHTLRKADWHWHHAHADDLRLEMLQEALLRVIAKIGAPAAPAAAAVTDLLANPSTRVRRSGATALGQLGPPARSAMAALAVTLMDDAEPVRQAALEALPRIDQNWPASAELRDLLERLASNLNKNGTPGRAAADALVAAGEAAVPVLVRALASADRIEREAAATALGRLGPRAQAAVPALRSALEDSHGWLREAVAKALRQVEPDGVK
jgi:HEAT repeat protein